MVSESNTNMRHLQISNSHDQIHYNNNTSKPGGHIQKSIQFKVSRHFGKGHFGNGRLVTDISLTGHFGHRTFW